MRIDEEYSDVLQNIESTIVIVYEREPKLVDREVLVALDSLLREYERVRRNRDGITPAPAGRARFVYEQCHHVCEWRLGRLPLSKDEPACDVLPPGELSVPELIRCLKWLRKSMRLWHKQGGRQGYLNYVREFFADASS